MHTQQDLENAELGLQTKAPYWGMLSVDESEQDFQFGADLKLPEPPRTFWDEQIVYAQNEVSSVSCTCTGPLTAISALTGYRFTLEQRKEIWAEALRRGAKEGWGWSMQGAVTLIREYASRYLGKELIFFRLDWHDEEEVLSILDAGYTINVGYQGNSAFNKDRNDGRLDEVSFGDLTYGHSLAMTRSKDGGETYEIIADNYPTSSRPNVYEVPRANVAALLKNGVLYRSAYVFLVKADFDAYNAETPVIPIWATKTVEKARKLGIEDWSNPNEVVGNSVSEAIYYKLGGLTKLNGDLTKARELVALDRLGVLDKALQAKGL